MNQLNDHPMVGETVIPPSATEGASVPLAELDRRIAAAVQGALRETGHLTPQTPVPSTSPEPRNTNIPAKKRFAQLSEYDGNVNEWEAWSTQATFKLRCDGTSIGTPQDQLGYLFTRLKGAASRSTVTYAQERAKAGDGDPWMFLDYMNTIFGDPAKEERAISQLNTARQGKTEPFARFLPKFETLLAHAGGTTWPEKVKIDYLDRSLHPELKDRSIGLGQRDTYTHFKNLLLQISNGLVSYRATQPLQFGGNGSRGFGFPGSRPFNSDTARAGPSDPDPMDWQRTNNTRTPERRNGPCGCTDRHTCGRKRATWVSTEVLNYRWTKGLCIRCGNSGHMQARCPLLPAVRPNEPVRTNQNEAVDSALAKSDTIEEEEMGKE